MTTAPQRRYTEEEYLELEAQTPLKHEFYRGEIFAMAGGSRERNQIVRGLFGELYIQLKGKDCIPYTSETRVKVQQSTLYTYPNIAVACKPLHFAATGSETLLNPRVLIEVLSASTLDHDFGFKSMQYRQIPSLQEMLFISQDEPFVDHFLRQPNGDWLLTTTTDLESTLRLPSIACEIPLRLIYADITFPGR